MIEANELCKLFERNIKAEDTSCADKTFMGKRKPGRKKRTKGRMKKEEFYAVDHVSIRADAGEIIGILGPNGAGKTTLLRMLGMLMTPTQGSFRITDSRGNEITDHTKRKAAIGYLSGNTRLYPRFSIREYLTFLGELYGLDKSQIEERIAEIFRVLDMDKFGDNRIERLSTGQLQRASIARCLMADPEIYILDEPTLGLDILSADAIIRFMKAQKERGKTVLYSTHYLEEAQFLCDRIYMILDGRIQAHGTPQELLDMTQTANLREAFHVVCDTVKNGKALQESGSAGESENAQESGSVGKSESVQESGSVRKSESVQESGSVGKSGSVQEIGNAGWYEETSRKELSE